MPTNLQNFTKKDLTEVKIFQKVVGGATFLKHPVLMPWHSMDLGLLLKKMAKILATGQQLVIFHQGKCPSLEYACIPILIHPESKRHAALFLGATFANVVRF